MPLAQVRATRTWLTLLALWLVARAGRPVLEESSVQLLERWYDKIATRYPDLGHGWTSAGRRCVTRGVAH